MKYLIILVSLLFVHSANAIEGNSLYEMCKAPDGSSEQSFCLGYVGATYQALISLHNEKCNFQGKKVSTVQLKDIAIKYFKENPENRHYDAFGSLFIEFGRVAECIPK